LKATPPTTKPPIELYPGAVSNRLAAATTDASLPAAKKAVVDVASEVDSNAVLAAKKFFLEKASVNAPKPLTAAAKSRNFFQEMEKKSSEKEEKPKKTWYVLACVSCLCVCVRACVRKCVCVCVS